MNLYHPTIDLFGITISSWTLFGWGNILLAKVLILVLAWQRGWDLGKFLIILVGFTFGAALGSLLLPSIMGTLAGAILAYFLLRWGIDFNPRLGDLLAIYIALVVGLGRIGCLLNGCCFGIPGNLPWSITYPVGTAPHWLHTVTGQIPDGFLQSLPVHPVPLYEALFLLGCVPVLLGISRRVRNRSALLPGFFGFYLLFRFVMEFYRGMTNVWWSIISWGPLAVFQWFLLLAALLFLSGAVLMESGRVTLPAFYWNSPGRARFFSMGSLLVIWCVTLLWARRLHPIHLVQLAVLLPAALLFPLFRDQQVRLRRWIPALGLSLILIMAAIPPVLSSLSAQAGAADPEASPPQWRKTWLYGVDHPGSRLVRIGERDLNRAEFYRRHNYLTRDMEVGIADSVLYQLIRSEALRRPALRYFAGGAFGNYSYRQTGCGGEVTTYRHTYTGGFVGLEKEFPHATKPTRTAYLGFRGDSYHDRWTKSGSSVSKADRGPFRDQYLSLHTYGNLEYKYAGIGTGISWFPRPLEEDIRIFPNAYLRLGPQRFALEAGLMDRYVVRPDQLNFHLNLVFRQQNNMLRMGVLNLGPTTGFFLDFMAAKETGLSVQPMLIFGEGFGLNLKFGYIPTDLHRLK